MGKLIRLDIAFNNSNLPNIGDSETIRNSILALPSLRAFYDFTDLSFMTLDESNNVSHVKDLSSNLLHAQQSSLADSPVYEDGVLNGQGGINFDGTKSLSIPSLFSGNQKQTVIWFGKLNNAPDGSRIVLSHDDNVNNNFYVQSGSLLAFAGNTVLSGIDNTVGPIHYICGFNSPSNKSILISNSESIVGNVGGSPSPVGDASLGTWEPHHSDFGYVGYLGHLIVLDEDISESQELLTLLKSYAEVKYNSSLWED